MLLGEEVECACCCCKAVVWCGGRWGVGPWVMWVQPEGEVVRVRFDFWGVECLGMVGGGGDGKWWGV